MNNLKERMVVLVTHVLGLDSANSILSMPRSAITEWDSLKHIELLLAIEEEFSVEFSDFEIAKLQSINELIALVAHKAGA